MNVDAIIFDKDGTLIDFDAFWVTVSEKAIEDVLKGLGREDIPVTEILAALGVHNGVTDVDSVLCKGTYEQMGNIIHSVLRAHGCSLSPDETVRTVVAAYNRHADEGEVKPTCPALTATLALLKRQNKRLAVVTTDNEEITRKCLKRLGVEELFDNVYTDDGKTPMKPDPYCALDFCQRSGVSAERMLMVGDTMTDVLFAKNAGIRVVGLANTPESRKLLSPHADAVLSAIDGLPDLLD